MIIFSEPFIQKYIAKINIFQFQKLFNGYTKSSIFKNSKNNTFFTKNVTSAIKKSNKEIIPNIIGSLLNIFLIKLISSIKQEENNNVPHKSQEIFFAFKKLVEKDYTKFRDAKNYSNLLSISYKHLNTICKITINRTAKNYIDDYVILESKRLLISTNLNISEVSYQIGFEELTNFIKFFKKHTSQTPTDFRNYLSNTF